MLTVLDARKIGIKACIEKIGYEFCQRYAENSTSAYSEEDGVVFCYVGVDDSPISENDSQTETLILTSKNEFPYSASCNVDLKDGTVSFLDCVLPKR